MFRDRLRAGLADVGQALREPEAFALRWHKEGTPYSTSVFAALILTAMAGTLTYGLTIGLLGGPGRMLACSLALLAACGKGSDSSAAPPPTAGPEPSGSPTTAQPTATPSPSPSPSPSPVPPQPSNFDACVALVLASEGFNDDDPRDPGGRTSRGVTQREYDIWRRTHNKLLAVLAFATRRTHGPEDLGRPYRREAA